VFRGNLVRDEHYQWAIFDELSSSPATLEASKAVDAYGLMDKNTIEQCDIHVCSLVNVAQRSGALGSTHYFNRCHFLWLKLQRA